MVERDDLGEDWDRCVWEPALLRVTRRRPTDAMREAREEALRERARSMENVFGEGAGQPHAEPARAQATRSLPLHLSTVRAPWCREQLERRGAVTYMGSALPRGERWLRAALLAGGAVLVVRIVVGLIAR